MKNFIWLVSLLQVGLSLSFSLSSRSENLSKRFVDSSAMRIGCIHMASSPGKYWFESEGDNDGVCGLFLIAQPSQLIEISFEDFDIDCSTGGLLALVDGWETRGQFFPSEEDHELPMEMRYLTYCDNKPQQLFVSSQNVALIQFMVPGNGQGFKINVNFIENSQPCNVMTMAERGVMTIRNYGNRRNCSASILAPARIKILGVDVGETSESPAQQRETGLVQRVLLQCEKRGRDDYVQLLAGSGLDTSLMTVMTDMCGLISRPSNSVTLPCGHTVVRLVSSGHFYNSLTFGFITTEQADDLHSQICYE